MFQYILLITATLITLNPLSLSWNKKYIKHPEIQDYRYYYGSVLWGEVIYLGTKDILGMESEIQLFFNRKKITRAHLILGPAGLNEWNCINKYKKAREMLVDKYGKYTYVKETRDPILPDLLTTQVCYPIMLGLREIDTYWDTKDHKIQLSLIGDEREFFIEITYIHKNRDDSREKDKRKEIIKKF